MENKTKSNRGGKRKGAGRPANPIPKKVFGIRATHLESVLLEQFLNDIRSGFIKLKFRTYALFVNGSEYQDFASLDDANKYIEEVSKSDSIVACQLVAITLAGETEVNYSTVSQQTFRR